MRNLAIILTICMVIMTAACGESPRVAQGIVTEYDPDSGMLSLTDGDRPGETIKILLKNTEMGAPPSAGDVIRVSYRIKDNRPIAVRIMHISTQAEHSGSE